MKVCIRITKRKSKLSRQVFLLFFFPILGIYFLLNFLPKTYTQSSAIEPIHAVDVHYQLPPLLEKKEIIQKGRTLSDILEAYMFSPSEIHQLRQDVKPVYDLAKIIAGQELRLYTFQDGKVVSLEYDIDQEHYLHIERKESIYHAEIKEYPIEVKTCMIWGTIEDFPISSIEKLGEKAELAIRLENIFAWDVDFRYDLRKGDSFKVVFEKKYLDDKFLGYGRILAAEFNNGGKIYQAFRYTYPDNDKSDYFDMEGNSLRKEFLKSPLLSPRVTSRFSHNRYHPVRKVFRPHYGVDFGAPVGTRVYATAEGTVIFAGWNGASGRLLRIRHKKGYETMYLHLRRFAPGIKRGNKVQSGQYIAQVGASGEVNGPHLDYRIKHHGTYINPLSARFDPVEPLRQEYYADFLENARYYEVSFDAPFILLSLFHSIPASPQALEAADE